MKKVTIFICKSVLKREAVIAYLKTLTYSGPLLANDRQAIRNIINK